MNRLVLVKLICLFLLISMSKVSAQKSVKITIIHDGDQATNGFLDLVEEEINALLAQQYEIKYKEVSLRDVSQGPLELARESEADDSDILISLGIETSGALQALGNYSKPCIAGISLPRTEQTSTGIDNFTLIQSPFSVDRDFELFQAIYPFTKLAVFIQPNLMGMVKPYVSSFADGFDIQFISISEDPAADLELLDSDVDAIYFLPALYRTQEQDQTLIDGINSRKLPSFSLMGRVDVENGILASLSASNYIGIYARRIGLNVMKILEGENPKDLPIHIDGVEDDFVINVATMKQLEVYPPFDVLSQASLIKLESRIGKAYTLESAVAEALNNNLTFRAAQRDVFAQQTEIGIAKSNLLPGLDANSTLVTLDGNSAEQLKLANQLTPQTAWSGNLALSQLIYSQPAWANVAIQEALLESEKASLMSQQLDLVLDVCTAYLRFLQAQANQNIQNTNVQTTLSNLNIAKTKAKIGAVSNADVYGFESQLALNKTSLNDAQTSVEQARISFNQLLNRPLDESFVLDDLRLDSEVFFLQDERMSEKIQNNYDFRKFAEFLIETAMKNSPEIEQLQWLIEAQESSLAMNKKSRYLPQVGLQGNLDQTFGRYGTRVDDQTFEAIGIDPYQPTWNIGLSASLPLFQGNLRNKKIEKDQILLEQLGVNQEALQQQFATNIHLSLENLGNSYNDIQFTRQAQQSSLQYLKIVQDLYREGVTNIVTLLDAQNNALSAQLGAVSSLYQFIIDAITIERLFNQVYLLSSDQERESFIKEYLAFITKKDENE